jgi:hypothetical protein
MIKIQKNCIFIKMNIRKKEEIEQDINKYLKVNNNIYITL